MSRSSSAKRTSRPSAKQSSKLDHSKSNTSEQMDDDLSAVMPAEIIDNDNTPDSTDPSVHSDTTTELAKTHTTTEALKKQQSHERKHWWMYLSALLAFLLMLTWFVWSQWPFWTPSSSVTPALSPLSSTATTEKTPTVDHNAIAESNTNVDNDTQPSATAKEEAQTTVQPSQEASTHPKPEQEPTQHISTNPVATNEPLLSPADALVASPENDSVIPDEANDIHAHNTLNTTDLKDGDESSTTTPETHTDFTDDRTTQPTAPDTNATIQTLHELQQQVQQLKQTLNDLQKQQQFWQQDLAELRSNWQIQWQVSQETQLNQYALVAWQQLQLVTSMTAFDTWKKHHQTLPTHTLPLPVTEPMQTHWQQWIEQATQQAQFLTTAPQRIALWHELFHKPLPNTLKPMENTTSATDHSGFDWQSRWHQLFKVTVLHTDNTPPAHTSDTSISERHTLDDLFQAGLTALQDNHIQAFQSIVQQVLSLSSSQLTSIDQFQAQLTYWAEQGWAPQWPQPHRFEWTNTHYNPTE